MAPAQATSTISGAALKPHLLFKGATSLADKVSGFFGMKAHGDSLAASVATPAIYDVTAHDTSGSVRSPSAPRRSENIVCTNGQRQAPISPAATFRYVVATYDGAEALLFVGGVRCGTTTVERALPDASAPLSIGIEGGNRGPFRGVIDEVALYDRPLT